MTPEITKKLTLFDLERELVELMEFAEEATAEDEILQARVLIEQYLEKRADKVDAIRGYLKHCDMIAACAREEVKDQAARAKAWEARAQRLKDTCVSVMQQFGEKRLEGRTGELKLHANPPSVEIYDAMLLPVGVMRYKVTFSGALWERLMDFRDRFRTVIQTLAPGLAEAWGSTELGEVTPDKMLIVATLKTPCRACDGTGRHGLMRIDPGEAAKPPCGECAGTGHQLVPGARLVTDKAHLKIT